MLISRSLTILAMVLLTLVVGSPVRAQEDAADDGDGIEVVDEIETPAAVDVPKPAPPVEDSAPATQSTEEPASTSPTFVDELPKLRVRGQANPDEVFGRYRVRVGMARPRFDDGLKFYDELYGKTSWYPTLSADWFAWDWYATLGLSFRGGYYTDRGHAARVVSGKAVEDVEPADIEQDPNGETSLTLLPLQVALTAEMTPFPGKWLVIDGWFGVERLYWQEVRSSSQSNDSAALISATSDESSDDALTNKGWKNSTVIGASANIMLNPFDQSSASSMRGSMGLGFVYLSPFMEIVRTTSKDGVSFGRTSYGLGFTFESSH